MMSELISRKNLSQSTGPRYWRSLDELSQSLAFKQMIAKEFPDHAGELEDGTTRRNFLRYMAASLELAGLGSGCTKRPEGKIIPCVRQPEEMIPGKPLFFATASTFGGYARGILVESHEGRPTKIEGNPDHPASLGSADAIGQAHVLDLYDPDRSQTVKFAGDDMPAHEEANCLAAACAAMRGTKLAFCSGEELFDLIFHRSQ